MECSYIVMLQSLLEIPCFVVKNMLKTEGQKIFLFLNSSKYLLSNIFVLCNFRNSCAIVFQKIHYYYCQHYFPTAFYVLIVWCHQDGKQFGDEYLAELDLIESVEATKEGYESDVEPMTPETQSAANSDVESSLDR